MVDRQLERASEREPSPLIVGRLAERWTMLATAGVVLLALVAFAHLSTLYALAAALVLMLAAVALPMAGQAAGDQPAPSALVGDTRLEVADLADALIDPCLVLDRRSLLRYRNGLAARKFPQVTPDRPITLVMRNPELVHAIEAAWRQGATQIIELHETLPTETWEKVAVAPLTSHPQAWLESPDPLLLVTFQSLTELKRVDAMRTDFIANASHEMRTPLTSLIGFIDTLLGPAARDVAARDKFLLIMRSQAERMAKLIEDMLSLSRIEMHQHVRPTGSVDVLALLREVREGLQLQAASAHVTIELKTSLETAEVTGDRQELYEVFENLIENAIKYGAEGKRVELTLETTDQPGFAYQLAVADFGPGVEPEHVPRLTERFYRIDADASRRKKGTGLGLAIAKHIISRHRGQMTIRSRPGEGLRVDILLR